MDVCTLNHKSDTATPKKQPDKQPADFNTPSKSSPVPIPLFSLHTLATSPTKSEQPSIPEGKCKEIIDSIRQQEFGVGRSFSDTSASTLIEKQHQRIGRALKRLSHELYSHDTHFVLELVQNADDNSYQSDILPTLKFCIFDKFILSHHYNASSSS